MPFYLQILLCELSRNVNFLLYRHRKPFKPWKFKWCNKTVMKRKEILVQDPTGPGPLHIRVSVNSSFSLDSSPSPSLMLFSFTTGTGQSISRMFVKCGSILFKLFFHILYLQSIFYSFQPLKAQLPLQAGNTAHCYLLNTSCLILTLQFPRMFLKLT